MIIFSILGLLFSNAITIRRDLSILYNRIGILSLLYCFFHEITSLTVLTKGLGIHGGLVVVTNITQIFHIFIFLISMILLILTSFYSLKGRSPNYSLLSNIWFYFKGLNYSEEKVNKTEEQFKIIEYPLILLFIITGAILLMSANDFITIFLCIELQSYGLYILSTIYRNSELSTSGGLIYFLLGGLSSCFILLGSALIYANSGTTSLDAFYIISSISELDYLNLWYQPYYINLSLILFSIGFLFKVSAAPFHFWSPDVYDAIPTIVTVFVAIIAKLSIFILLLQLSYYCANDKTTNWTFIILLSSFFSLIIGTIVGLTQFRIKRLLAYSTISHVGFILLALGISSVESTQAFLFYLIQYTISNLNVFVILIAIGFSLYYFTSNNPEHEELWDKKNSPIQLITQLKGYYYLNPLLSISLAITIFSFVGVPPLLGFFGKQMVLSAALDKSLIFLSLVAILTSVIGAIYYLSIIKEMFFNLPEYTIKKEFSKKYSITDVIYSPYKGMTTYIPRELSEKEKSLIFFTELKGIYINLSSPISFTISCITLIILMFIFINKEWLSMGTVAVQVLFNN